MSVIAELQGVIKKIDNEKDRTAAVKIMSDYLQIELIRRCDEPTQARKLHTAFDANDLDRVRLYRKSQFSRVAAQAETFEVMLAGGDKSGQVRVLRPEEAACRS